MWCILGLTTFTIQASNQLADYITIIQSSPIEFANLYDNAIGTQEQFITALCAGNIEKLESLPKKNWLSKFTSKNKVYLNDLVNMPISNSAQDSPLHLAARIAGYHNDISINYQVPQPLRQAASNKYKNMLKVVQFLIDNQAHVNAQNKNGQTALHLACLQSDAKLNHLLLNAGANPMIQDHAHNIAMNYVQPHDVDFKKFEMDFNKAINGDVSEEKLKLEEAIEKNQRRSNSIRFNRQDSVKLNHRKIAPEPYTNIMKIESFDSNESATTSSDETNQRKQETIKQKSRPKTASTSRIAVNNPEQFIVNDSGALVIDTMTTQRTTSTTDTIIEPQPTYKSKAPVHAPQGYIQAQHAAQDYIARSKTNSMTQTKSTTEIKGW